MKNLQPMYELNDSPNWRVSYKYLWGQRWNTSPCLRVRQILLDWSGWSRYLSCSVNDADLQHEVPRTPTDSKIVEEFHVKRVTSTFVFNTLWNNSAEQGTGNGFSQHRSIFEQ